MPLMWANMIQAGLPVGNMGDLRRDPLGLPVRGADRQLARRAGADRRRRRHHAVELPAPPDRRQGRPGARRGLHRRPQAQRGRPAERLHPGRDHRRGRPARRRVQPRHRRRPGRRRGHRRPPRRRHGQLHRLHPGRQAGQPSWPPTRSSGSPSSSAASRPTSSSTTPTSPRSCPRASSPATSTRARPAPPTPGCSCRSEKHDEAVAIAAAAAEGFPVGPADQDGVMLGPLIVRRPARPGAGLHPARASTRAPRWPPAVPRRPRAWTPGYFVQPDRVRQRVQRHDHRPGGDLRPGAVDHPLRRRRRRDPHRQRHPVRPRRRRVVGRRGAGPAGRPPDAHRPGRRQRRQLQHRGALRWLQAVRASVASSARTASRSSSR